MVRRASQAPMVEGLRGPWLLRGMPWGFGRSLRSGAILCQGGQLLTSLANALSNEVKKASAERRPLNPVGREAVISKFMKNTA